MNAAFNRGKAISKIEGYAEIIVVHLTLLVCFPSSQDIPHWKNEVENFKNILRNYHRGKKGRKNFKPGDIKESLEDIIKYDEDKENIINDIIGIKKGMPLDYTTVDWVSIEKSIDVFEEDVLNIEL